MLNNLFTYRDQRLTGWRFVTGLIRFQVICAIGAISNVGIATWIYDYDSVWWIAGLGGAADRDRLEFRGQRRLRLAAAVIGYLQSSWPGLSGHPRFECGTRLPLWNASVICAA